MFKLTTKQLTLTGVLGALMIIMGLIGGLVPVPNLAGAMTLYHIPIIIGAIVCGPTVGFLLGVIFATILFIQMGAAFPPHVLLPARVLIGPFAWLAFTGVKKLFGKEETIKPIWAYIIGGLVIAGILFVGIKTFNVVPPEAVATEVGKIAKLKPEILTPLQQGIQSITQAFNSLSTNGIMFTIALAFAFGIPGIITLLKMKKISTATSVAAVVGTLTNTVITLGLAVVFGVFPFGVVVSIAATNGVIELILAVVLCMAIVPPLLERFGESAI
ncbi:MAG: ECF transporter S component [Caldisericia bacterium]